MDYYQKNDKGYYPEYGGNLVEEYRGHWIFLPNQALVQWEAEFSYYVIDPYTGQSSLLSNEAATPFLALWSTDYNQFRSYPYYNLVIATSLISGAGFNFDQETGQGFYDTSAPDINWQTGYYYQFNGSNEVRAMADPDDPYESPMVFTRTGGPESWNNEFFESELHFGLDFNQDGLIGNQSVEPPVEPPVEPDPGLENVFDWGVLNKNENYYHTASVSEGGTYEIYFTASDSQVIYTYFDLYNFTDDLDLYLFRLDGSSEAGDLIANSEAEGIEVESIFKGLTPGNYVLQISHFDDLDGESLRSDFTVDINSEYFYDNATLPDDTLFPSQWHLINTGQSNGFGDKDIMAPEAWNIRSESPDIVVAVIDGGVQLDHPDLVENIWSNSGEIPGNGLDDDKNGYVDDVAGWNFANDSANVIYDVHGTHVAGIIGADGNNGIGVAGVTWDVQLMSLDVFGGKPGASDEDIVDAIYYAVDNGAHVINMSLGGTIQNATIDEWRSADPNGYASYYEALNYAVINDATVVIAAGNEDLNNDVHLSIPAAFSSVLDGVISVAALTNSGDLTWYSNYGSLTTIAAPGGNLDDFDKMGSGILSTVIDSGYDYQNGTSMASPVVAGAAALIKAQNSNFTPSDVESILTQSAQKNKSFSSLVEQGNFLDLSNALQLSQTFEPSPNPQPNPEPYGGIIRSVIGKGKLKGTKFADAFTFESFDVFTKKAADKIAGFDGSEGDTIAVSPSAFPALKGASEINFASTSKKKELKLLSRQDYDFIYFEKKGRLYFDGNGAGKDWGDTNEGGLFAILKGKPELNLENFTLLI